MSDLNAITKELGKYHKEKMESTKELSTKRLEFFDAATEEIENTQTLASQIISFDEAEDKDVTPEEYTEKYLPGWKYVKEVEGRGFEVVEDPALKKFVWVNKEDGLVYTRNVLEGAPYLNDEKLAEEHPDVWERLSEPITPDLTLVEEFASDWDQYEYLLAWLDEKDFPRRLKDTKDADPTDLDIMYKYVIPGKLSLELKAPREAKSEELE